MALGRFYRRKTPVPGAKKAVEYFEQALKADLSYADAYAGLADSFTASGILNALPPKEAYSRAEAGAGKALEMAANSVEVRRTLANIRALRRDWTGAEREFQRVLDLDPTTPHSAYAMHYRERFSSWCISTPGSYLLILKC